MPGWAHDGPVLTREQLAALLADGLVVVTGGVSTTDDLDAPHVVVDVRIRLEVPRDLMYELGALHTLAGPPRGLLESGGGRSYEAGG